MLLGAFYASLWVVPINHHLTPPEIRYQPADAVRAWLFTERNYVHLVPPCLPVTVLEDENLADAVSTQLSAAPDFDQPAVGMMLHTSGTSCRRMRLRAAIGAHLLVATMYHAAPLLFTLYDLFNGASVYMMRRFDAESMLGAIERWQISHTHVVPTMLVRLAKLPQSPRQRWKLSSLRPVLHGEARHHQLVGAAAERVLGWNREWSLHCM